MTKLSVDLDYKTYYFYEWVHRCFYFFIFNIMSLYIESGWETLNSIMLKCIILPCVVLHAHNPSTQEAEAGKSQVSPAWDT
jgi:hypothetical protein